MRSYSEYLKSKQDEPLLLQAARVGDIGTIAREILAGANVNEKNHRGYSALMLTAYNDHYDAAVLLIESGADVNTCDKGGNTVLMGAAFKGHFEILQLLLKEGADIHLRNFANQTALDFAKTFGRKEIIPLLERHGKVPNIFQRIGHFISFFLNQLTYKIKNT
ncbi:MAG TPA: ankyrin repeat domain-containing protein [Bdellovibrio sp.]|uniref:ankyrin repeat domain-containing protein n=1 Tax=Bdellovibrio sp. TaxID=28201 RepID=UPI002F0F53A0